MTGHIGLDMRHRYLLCCFVQKCFYWIKIFSLNLFAFKRIFTCIYYFVVFIFVFMSSEIFVINACLNFCQTITIMTGHIGLDMRHRYLLCFVQTSFYWIKIFSLNLFAVKKIFACIYYFVFIIVILMNYSDYFLVICIIGGSRRFLLKILNLFIFFCVIWCFVTWTHFFIWLWF